MVNIAKLLKAELKDIGLTGKVVEMKQELREFLKCNYLKAKDFTLERITELYNTRNETEQREECPICLDNPNEVIICKTCSNSTCNKCYSIITKDKLNAKCPFCRTLIFEEEIKKRAELQEYYARWNNRINQLLISLDARPDCSYYKQRMKVMYNKLVIERNRLFNNTEIFCYKEKALFIKVQILQYFRVYYKPQHFNQHL